MANEKIVKVRVSGNQKLITVPVDSPIEEGDYVKIVALPDFVWVKRKHDEDPANQEWTVSREIGAGWGRQGGGAGGPAAGAQELVPPLRPKAAKTAECEAFPVSACHVTL